VHFDVSMSHLLGVDMIQTYVRKDLFREGTTIKNQVRVKMFLIGVSVGQRKVSQSVKQTIQYTNDHYRQSGKEVETVNRYQRH
jgi:hypothetical protein